jgi:hypothetical protein
MQTGIPMITKVDGNVEQFDHRKLQHSLRRSGADETLVTDIVAHIESEISDGMSTDEIYRHACTLLKERHKIAAVKYSLRRALFSLGPTGFPFEDFLAELFQTQGYETKTGVILRGRCVEHEVDLIAYKANHCFIAEAKFHAHPGVKSDLQVALYSHARFQDLKGMYVSPNHPCEIVDSYIITNTKFTHVAIEYAKCVGVKLLSWSYPKEKTLQNHIEEAGIYPITALTTLSVQDKRRLLENGIVLCKDMAHKRDILRSLGFPAKKIETLIEESVNICTSA